MPSHQNDYIQWAGHSVQASRSWVSKGVGLFHCSNDSCSTSLSSSPYKDVGTLCPKTQSGLFTYDSRTNLSFFWDPAPSTVGRPTTFQDEEAYFRNMCQANRGFSLSLVLGRRNHFVFDPVFGVSCSILTYACVVRAYV